MKIVFLQPMLLIKDLFSSAENSKIEQYITNTKDFSTEIVELKSLLVNPEYDRALFIFYVELLAKAIKKPADMSQFLDVLLAHIEEIASIEKMSVIVLRCLRALCNSRFYIPLSFYLTKLMSTVMGIKNIKRVGKRIDYDHIKITAEEAQSEELQMFIIRECTALIKRHCQSIGGSIGFPEVANVICNELKAQCKTGIYREMTMDLVKWISKRKSYIEEQRNKIAVDSMDMAQVAEFEKNLEEWRVE